ncbi:MAG: FGGY-family carbohydrate kinase [Spirochaetaceae bacterium]|jgi:sugar (pentulose or hexulose) kinase|nr:FGGY-family carbohydrate kinase [Spirochaetaceae bacterium]
MMRSDHKTFLGIELGSTRIKGVLIDGNHRPLGSGAFDWENKLVDGLWTYSLEDVWKGLQGCVASLVKNLPTDYTDITGVSAIGVSAMMHGYLAFDKDGNLLVPFRTWRNTTTAQAAEILTEKFGFNIPQRWSAAHLYQAVLNNEAHVRDIAFITTLSGYVHWKLTGKKVIGIGDASGMFPIDSATGTYDGRMLAGFDALTVDRGYGWKLQGILPAVLSAGENAGSLTGEGAALIDPAGRLKPGIPLCPPEGDAGTGMVATDSVAPRTGNVSAGTSVFAMVVLEKPLGRVHPEIDLVTTPDGRPVAMVHCNNCTSDIDAWANLFAEATELFGPRPAKSDLYDKLYYKALEGESDCGGLVAYNYYSGEPVTGFDLGRPLFARLPESRLCLGNFMRTLIFSALGTLKLGMDILTGEEKVRLDCLYGHGGLFKTQGVGQKLMAAALNVPVAVMESAGEGGAWGIALLAAYMMQKTEESGTSLSLEAYLAHRVFAAVKGIRMHPEEKDVLGFRDFLKSYEAGLAMERAAVESL